MVDIFALTLSHVLLLYAAWRLVQREALDHETPRPTAGQRQRERRRDA